ncbi:unnamed protein product [Urochloa humidicola]
MLRGTSAPPCPHPQVRPQEASLHLDPPLPAGMGRAGGGQRRRGPTARKAGPTDGDAEVPRMRVGNDVVRTTTVLDEVGSLNLQSPLAFLSDIRFSGSGADPGCLAIERSRSTEYPTPSHGTRATPLLISNLCLMPDQGLGTGAMRRITKPGSNHAIWWLEQSCELLWTESAGCHAHRQEASLQIPRLSEETRAREISL